MKRNKGFSLVELSIAIVIVGILIAMGMKMLIPLVERTKRAATREAVDAAVAAVIGFAETNNRLPSDLEFPGVVRNSKDVWGKDLIYLHDINLEVADSVCARNTTGISLKTCASSGCATPVDTTGDVAFLVLSGGANQNVQTNTGVSPVKVYNMGLPGIDDYAAVLNRPEAYDDIVERVVLPELRVKTGCLGSLLNILTIEIPSGFVLSDYITNIFASGGVAWDDSVATPGDTDTADDYRWCVTGTLPIGLSYVCNGTLAVSASCAWDAATATETGTWQQCTHLEISGAPTEDGAFSLPVFVRDNADNTAQRTFGMSISQVVGLHICTDYRVWNQESASRYFVNGGGCYDIATGGEITTVATGGLLQNGEVIVRHTGGGCGGSDASINYNQAIFADNNADCCVNHDQSDKTCP
ncbi:MAG: prepilin-type N-terminal cleavage/methylation domain-containing protein [Thermodesulfovibrionia bacterium]|nr:prepilin-type N-terminal cleavage/methylation domain-containing protein [Thermodesulfovibrionia bacterium]